MPIKRTLTQWRYFAEDIQTGIDGDAHLACDTALVLSWDLAEFSSLSPQFRQLVVDRFLTGI